MLHVNVCVLCKILVTMKSKWREHDITIQLGLCAKVSAFYFSERGGQGLFNHAPHTIIPLAD
jgi:hypothetical protein